jgi:putative endonuclease
MKYVYLLQSIEFPDQTYVGLTDDLRARFSAHNKGRSPHTDKYKPWRLVSYVAFSDERKAIEFERYLKSASGRAFAISDCVRNKYSLLSRELRLASQPYKF